MLVNFKTDIRYREEIPDRMEIFDASVLMQSVIEETALHCQQSQRVHVCHNMSIPKFKHKMQTSKLLNGEMCRNEY